jgi:hypothetical protein
MKCGVDNPRRWLAAHWVNWVHTSADESSAHEEFANTNQLTM